MDVRPPRSQSSSCGVQSLAMLEAAAQVAALGVILWVFSYQLPKARREEDLFAVTCSLLTALLALWFLLAVGSGVRSRA
jgi:hypothetical protein